jgi:hypothetical protein
LQNVVFTNQNLQKLQELKQGNLAEIDIQNENLINNEITCCEYCKKDYYSKYTLNRHLTTCKKKKKADAQANDLEFFKKKVLELEKLIMLQNANNATNVNGSNANNMHGINGNSNNVTNTNSNNTIINNTNNIKIVGFGKEDLRSLKKEEIGKLLDNIYLTSGAGVFFAMLDYVHFNPDKPEWQNFKITDKNRHQVTILDGKNENVHTLEQFLPEIIEKMGDKGDLLLELIDELQLKFKEKATKTITENLELLPKIRDHDEDNPIEANDYDDNVEYQKDKKAYNKIQTISAIIQNRMNNYCYNKTKAIKK